MTSYTTLKIDSPTAIEHTLENLQYREDICWNMAEVFLQNRDAHGIHDMGVEIQALQRATLEIKRLQQQ